MASSTSTTACGAFRPPCAASQPLPARPAALSDPARVVDTHSAQVCLVSHEEFRQALRQAGHGLAAALAYRYDARRDETVWKINGEAVGLTVGRIGATTACFLATPATGTDTAGRGQPVESPAAAVHGQVASLDTDDLRKSA